MQQLLEDSKTLPFKQGKNISLKILKQEINRRIIKIKNMLECDSLPSQNCKYTSCGSQTQNSLPNRKHRFSITKREIVSPEKQAAKMVGRNPGRRGKYSGRCSLPTHKSSFKVAEESRLKESNRVKLAQYLFSANESIKKEAKVSATQQVIQEAPQSIKFLPSNERNVPQPKFINSFKNSKQKSQLYYESTHPNNIPLIFEDMDEIFGLVDFDSEYSNLHYERAKSALRKTFSLKKVRFTERTALEQQTRVVVTQETMQRMSSEVTSLIAKKRREAEDNKLRENIFRKIQEKYGGYFDNI